MASVYGRLGFDSSGPIASTMVQPLSDTVLTQMKVMPPWMNAWQTKDVAEANTGGYFQNPVANTIITVNNVANTMMLMANGNPIIGTTLTITKLLSNTKNTAITIGYSNAIGILINYSNTHLVSECTNFKYITDRLSNVADIGSDVDTPHYSISIGYGKMMNYVMNQTDGVQNNSPIIGGFSSVFSANVLNAIIANTTPLLTILTNSLTGNNSSISLSDAQSLDNNMNQLLTTMVTCRTNDKNFYQNSNAIFNDYNQVSQFNNMGQSENQLIQIIGSPKLLSRLNDTANN